MNGLKELAEQAGIDKWWDNGNEQREVLQEHLEAFAKLVAAKEREACAKICETRQDEWRKAGFWGPLDEFHNMASAIRARK